MKFFLILHANYHLQHKGIVITDGYCDVLHVHRDHAYPMPESRFLPFFPKGPIFRLK